MGRAWKMLTTIGAKFGWGGHHGVGDTHAILLVARDSTDTDKSVVLVEAHGVLRGLQNHVVVRRAGLLHLFQDQLQQRTTAPEAAQERDLSGVRPYDAFTAWVAVVDRGSQLLGKLTSHVANSLVFVVGVVEDASLVYQRVPGEVALPGREICDGDEALQPATLRGAAHVAPQRICGAGTGQIERPAGACARRPARVCVGWE